MPERKAKGPEAFKGYKGILGKRLPFDPHWGAIGTFSNLRAIASLNGAASDAPEAVEVAADDSVPPNHFAPRFFPPDLDERIAALYEAHGVEYGEEDALLFALVTSHVPGLTVERSRRGPARTWDVRQRAALKIAVERHIAEKSASGKSVSVTEACMHLANENPWKSLLRTAKKRSGPRTKQEQMREARSLCKQYEFAEDSWVKFERAEQAYEAWERKHPEEVAKQRKSRLAELLRMNAQRE